MTKAVLRFGPPFGGLGTTYDGDLRLIGKRVVNFLITISVNNCTSFAMCCTAEALRANID